MKTGKALISKEGVFATRSHAHRASVILDPNVSAPFVWVMTPLATKMRHMLWRTPVSRSRDFIYLYLNDQVTTIRRPFVVDCYRHLQTLERPANAKKIHQFMLSGDPDFREPEIGRMRGDLRKLFPSVSGLIGEMTLGEIWALNSLLLRGEVPEQPPRVDF
jgi:CRISPR type IV-associated protein Csf1